MDDVKLGQAVVRSHHPCIGASRGDAGRIRSGGSAFARRGDSDGGRPGGPQPPSWISARPLPSRSLSAILQRAVPVLKFVERIVRRRAPILTKVAAERVVGVIIVLPTIRLLTNPLPFSNVLPALLIALISLTYLEEDGLLLSIALVIRVVLISADTVLLWKMAHQFAART